MDINLLKQLREETQAGVNDCRAAITESGGDYKKALDIIRSRGLDKAAKKSSRATGAGLIDAYLHLGGKIGVLLELRCETDFVAKNDVFKALAHEISMHIAAMSPANVDELLAQPFVKDPSQTVKDMVQGAVGKLGENIQVANFARFEA